MLVPIESLKNSLNIFKETCNVYPVWLCPFVLPDNPGMVYPKSRKETLYVDIGLYGVPKVKNFMAIETMKKIEKYVTDING